MKVVKWKFRALLADRKLTNTSAGERIGVNRNTISLWRNRDVFPGVEGELLGKILEVLDCTLDELLYTDENS